MSDCDSGGISQLPISSFEKKTSNGDEGATFVCVFIFYNNKIINKKM